MIELRFTLEDLAGVRFAFSPLWELVASLRVLRDPAAHTLHLPWVARTRPRVAELDLTPLWLLVRPAGHYLPDFLTSPPGTPLPDFAEELDRVRATPPQIVDRELAHLYRDGPVPPALQPLRRAPRTGLEQLADLLAAYWRAALAEHWPSLRSLLEADVLHRARQLTLGGARRLFADLFPTISWSDGHVRVAKRWTARVELDGSGLVLMPSAFTWPHAMVVHDEPWQPTLIYPARGVGTLWETGEPAPAAPLAALVGAGRAAVLTALDRPSTTTELARRLGMSAGGVSGHLHRLHAAGLASRHRDGRAVLYARTGLGEQLLNP